MTMEEKEQDLHMPDGLPKGLPEGLPKGLPNEELLASCSLCPRNCRVDRLAGQTGYCGQTAQLRVARAALHFWEEPCISGTAGSGTVFFSGCPMRCVFCQNYEIANKQQGKVISVDRLAEIFLELQEKGANNINLVTPTHFAVQIAEALRRAKQAGLSVPVVYNTSSYENVETLRLLEGLVDIYLPDLKYASAALAGRYSNAPDYFWTAAAAIREMVRQVGEPLFTAGDGQLYSAAQMNEMCEAETDADFLMKKGVIVRHLALPGQAADSRRVIGWLHRTFGEKIYVSIMNQYTPLHDFVQYPELNERLSEEAYDALLEKAVDLGMENVFFQMGETVGESFIPAFDGEGV